MTQSVLYRSIARATGESVSRLRHMGFSLVSMPSQPYRRPRQRRSSGRSKRDSALLPMVSELGSHP